MSAPSIPPELIPYLLHEKQDNSSQQKSIITVNGIFLTLILLTTGLRFWVRIRILRSAGLDDILIIFAIIFATLLSISCLIGTSLGLGLHIWNLSPILTEIPEATGKITKSLYGAYLAYSTAITFTKFSIMSTYIRIFPNGYLRYIVYGTAILVLCFWIASIFAIIFTCVPVQAAWDYNLKGYCFPIVRFFYAAAGFHIATDLLLCFIPIPTLWALKMPRAQRAILICLFCMGTFACVASILRISHLNQLSRVDITYQAIGSLNWSVIEVDTGIVCASLSSLRPLVKRYLPKLYPQSSHSDPNEEPNSSISGTDDSASSILSTTKASAQHKLERPGSVVSIYVQKTFQVQSMKELPDLPAWPVVESEAGDGGAISPAVDFGDGESEREGMERKKRR